jgi:hypothetical protein
MAVPRAGNGRSTQTVEEPLPQDPASSRPTFVRTAIVLCAAVLAALGGGYAIAANAPTPRQVVSPPVAPSDFVGIAPVRVLDTRGAAGGPIGVPAAAKLGAGQTIDVKVAGVGTVPPEATSVAVNITIDEDATLKSFLTVWPFGQPKPNTSANNAEPGLVAANSAIFQVGTDGKLSVFNQQGAVNVIMDVTGYFIAGETTGTTTPTTTPGETTTTTIAASGPTVTATAAISALGNVRIAVTGTGWTECDSLVNVSVDADPLNAIVTNIEPDGTFAATKFVSPAPAAGTTITVNAVSNPDPPCSATTTVTVPAA